jgi:hypothetical protein
VTAGKNRRLYLFPEESKKRLISQEAEDKARTTPAVATTAETKPVADKK